MKYDILLFDADETLFDFEASEKEALKLTMIDFDFDYNEEYHLTLYKEINTAIWKELEQGIITQKQLKIERFNRFLVALQSNIDATEFATRYMKHLANASLLYEFSYDIIQQLHKNYRLAIVTNGLTDVQNGRVRNSTIGHFFDQIVISEEVGLSKPDPKIFEYALNKMNYTDKSRVLMIGDSLSSDIQGGINCGIDTCWYNPNTISISSNINPTYEIHEMNELFDILSK